MANANDIPEPVRRFIGEHIVSIEQLEVLLLLHRQRRDWTPEQVVEELRTSLSSATQRLEDLARRRLIARADAPGHYHFDGSDPRQSDTVAALEKVYGERRYTVIELIFSKPIENLRVYADAFRFRKDEDDG